MRPKLTASLRGLTAATLLALNTLVCVPILLLFALLKLLVPGRRIRLWVDPVLLRIAETWIAGNSRWMRLTQNTDWDVQGLEGLNPRSWYLVNANHQSWVDILVLQHLLNRRIPLLKFFLKQQLIWVPVIGLCWWALEFPFMKRFSKEYLAKHPEKRGQDMITTRKACERYKINPVSVFNFLEGTRLTPAKQAQQ